MAGSTLVSFFFHSGSLRRPVEVEDDDVVSNKLETCGIMRRESKLSFARPYIVSPHPPPTYCAPTPTINTDAHTAAMIALLS